MDSEIYDLHIRAGLAVGAEHTCGKKIPYSSEESAGKAAAAMNKKSTTRNVLEAYPCAFCSKWHVGRAMTPEEMAKY